MKNITTSSTTLIIGVLFASLQAPSRSGIVGDRRGSYTPAPTMTAVNDVASLRSWRPPV